MKIKILAAMMTVAAAAQATIYSGGTPSTTGLLPDGNPVGLVSTISVDTGGDANTINGVQVTLNLSGGYNGDLYGYLVNPSGNQAILLNRVGTGSGGAIQQLFGYANSGLNVILSDVGMPGAPALAGGIHTYGAGDITSGTTAWAPDNGTGDFTALQSGGAAGTWTLFLADLSTGSQSTLVNWGLTVSVVPEPVTWALGLMGALVALLGVGRLIRRSGGAGQVQKRITGWVDAV